jgi:hypothetical protein
VITALPGAARIKPLLQRMNSDREDDRRSASDAMTTYVSRPPTLDAVVRRLFGYANKAEFEVLVALLDTRRQLQALYEQKGKADLWEN